MLYRVRPVLWTALVAAALTACTGAPKTEGDGHGVEDASRAGDTAMPALPESPEFWADAAPVIFENCTPCHHKGGVGPFALTTFIDVKKRTKTIRKALATNFMPPWPADPHYRSFRNEKRLSKYDKAVLLRWIDSGAPEGQRPKDPPLPELAAAPSLGEPDVVLSFPDTVFIEGNNVDEFRIAKIPFELPRDTVLKAVAFLPGNKWLVHHVNGHMLNYETGKKKDLYSGEWIVDAETTSSLDAYRRMRLFQDDGTYPALLVSAFNYLPGVEPVSYPEGLGNIIVKKKGAFLLNTLHYGPSAIDTFDLSHIALYYADKRPERPMGELQLGTLGISPVVPDFVIPADTVSRFSTEYRVKRDLSVLTINPHMHLLGKTFKAYAYSPSKADTIPLIYIPKWDFRWQFFYTFSHMLHIPKGYTIRVEASFDNTADNPFNPFDPPRTLHEAGKNMKTTDEMFQFFVNYVPYRKGDEKVEL